MKIYQGEIKKMYTTDIAVIDDVITYLLTSSTIKEKAVFTPNRFGRLISMDYGVYLPTEEEAREYVISYTNNNPNGEKNSCIYVDYSAIKLIEVTDEEYKKLTLKK